MIKGDTPSSMICRRMGQLGFIRDQRSRRVLPPTRRKRMTITADTPWEMTVARAAPATSMCRP